jgi:chemotaxis protein CheD
VVIETMAQTEKFVFIGMGEMQVLRSPEIVLSCIGLGSCIAVCAYDRVARVGGMVHVVLPTHDGKSGNNLAKYANTAVPLLINEILAQGGVRPYLIVKIAGGAQMSMAPGISCNFKTGERNLSEAVMALEKAGVHLVGADTGGSKGRTVRLYLDTGRITVRTVGGVEREI